MPIRATLRKYGSAEPPRQGSGDAAGRSRRTGHRTGRGGRVAEQGRRRGGRRTAHRPGRPRRHWPGSAPSPVRRPRASCRSLEDLPEYHIEPLARYELHGVVVNAAILTDAEDWRDVCCGAAECGSRLTLEDAPGSPGRPPQVASSGSLLEGDVPARGSDSCTACVDDTHPAAGHQEAQDAVVPSDAPAAPPRASRLRRRVVGGRPPSPGSAPRNSSRIGTSRLRVPGDVFLDPSSRSPTRSRPRNDSTTRSSGSFSEAVFMAAPDGRRRDPEGPP